MSAPVVGLVGVGEMGSALGARLREGGARVVVALDDRSERTRRLAAEAQLENVGGLDALLGAADVVLSVVPPGEAVAVATELARYVGERRPLVVDLNAIAPGTARQIAEILARTGLETVDGSISGPPPHAAGRTRIYLSGLRASEVAALPFEGVERVVVGSEIGLASAVKMSTASVYKGRVAVLAQALRAAYANGVLEYVLDDLADTGLVDRDRAGSTLARASAKAWRYVDEMREIAATQRAAGLPPELFEAFAAVYADLAERAVTASPEEVRDDIPLEDVLGRFASDGPSPGARVS